MKLKQISVFGVWILPELGPFGNYLVFIWNVFVDTLFHLIVYAWKIHVWHANLTCPGVSPCSAEHI